MFGNIVNMNDFKEVIDKLCNNPNALLNIFRKGEQRIKKHWNEREISIANNPISARFNYLITGNPDVSRFEYACNKYLKDAKIKAVSLGCGSGEHEIAWARQGNFTKIDCFDISPTRIEIAKEKTTEAGLNNILNFYCENVLNLLPPKERYDVIIFESALHHLSPLKKVMNIIEQFLKPGGFIFMTDFVGPTKCQWLPRQLQVVNALLDLLPERYKIKSNGNSLKKVFKPSYLRMYLMDPSEAIESSNIIPMMRNNFSELELKNAGGAILNHLSSIMHNFSDSDPDARKWLDIFINAEDILLQRTEEIGWWYAFGVYTTRSI